MSAGPDFIIIGAMKCATSTLHEQLAQQPGFFMSTPKEPNFFSDPEQWARGMAWYRGLFSAAPPGALRGESSTHYTKLPTHPEVIDRIERELDTRRFVYVMREPLDRLVSHYIHEWTQRVIDVPLERAVELHPELVDYGRYAMQLRPWLARFGRAAVLPVFFERLVARPQEELTRIVRFVGASGEVRWREEVAARNPSRERLRRSPWRDALLELPGAAALRRRLVPKRVRERVKARWQMRERPTLTPELRARLVARFDEDLAELGEWLGRPLRCGALGDTARGEAPDWIRR